MSTTIKRVALVAVAALGLSVVAVAPSSAIPQADTLTLSSATASTTVGTAVTVDATVAFLQEAAADSMTLTLTYDAAPSGITVGEVAFSSITAVTGDVGTPSVDTSTARVAIVGKAPAASLQKTLKISLTPTKAGTYTIRVTPTLTGVSGTAPVSTFKTWTVTVAKKTIGLKTAFIGVAGTIATDTQTADSTAASLTFTASANTAAKARIDVGQVYGSTGNDTATAADAQSVVIATDRGLVSKTNDYSAAAKSVTTLAGVDADSTYFVFSNGDVGKASITITVDGSLLATKTVTFTGTAASLTAKPTTAAPLWVTLGTDTTTVIDSADSAGSALGSVPTGLTVKSSDTSVATVIIHATNGTVTVKPVKLGTATITVTDPATSGAATAVTFPVTVSPVKAAAAPTITFDKPTYNVGELVTMTVNANLGDKAATLFTAALKASAVVVATSTVDPFASATTTHTMRGGKVAYTFYAPTVSGIFTVTGTTSTDVDLTTAAAVSGTFEVTNAGLDAALDAANEAATAAQDATDAAIQAADAADEATAAVAALSLEVNTLIAGLKKQLVTLTNLVKNLQKAVAAKK
jgi:trimeric autotransporter adhesin